MQRLIWKIKARKVEKGKSWLSNTLAANRGLTTKKDLDEFLNPTFDTILKTKPTDMPRAVQRIISAIKKKEKIVVYSDYDADGICASGILWETLYDLGASVLPYVPHRVNEGYGLSESAITKLSHEGVSFIITVDHGVTAHKQVDLANKLGIDVIITDHHVLSSKQPKSFALVHTTDLCGAGVSWRLAWEVVQKTQKSYEKTLIAKLELTALATIADLVPLLGANRSIVKIGLDLLNKTKRFGIKALIRESGIRDKITTYEVGHILAPRINAMGRIEHGMDSLRLLCAKSQSKADELAKLLASTNTKRQGLTIKAIDSAKILVKKDHLIGVVSHEEWHEGVIGLVASRLVESFNKPMIAISRGEVYSKGSARSIAGFNIVEAIKASSEFLVDGGGHPMAAGFTIETRHIEIFTEKINQYAQGRVTEKLLQPVASAECEISVYDITLENERIIRKFEPFGVGNPEPLFITRNMLLEDLRVVGKTGSHLKLIVNGISAIAFNMGEKRALLRPGMSIDLLYSMAEDKYNGNGNIQLKVKDISTPN